MTQPAPTAPPTASDPAPAPATDPATPPAPPAGPAAPAATDDKPLGPAGEKALREEREARKELEKRLAGLAPLEKLAAAMGGGDAGKGKTEIETLTERQAAMEKTLADERAARWRAEVAHEKNLTPAQAARLVGADRAAMAADADALIALFPAPAPATPGTPAPDPSQGAQGTGPDLDARIAEAQKANDWRKVMSLQNEKLAALAAKS